MLPCCHSICALQTSWSSVIELEDELCAVQAQLTAERQAFASLINDVRREFDTHKASAAARETHLLTGEWPNSTVRGAQPVCVLQ